MHKSKGGAENVVISESILNHINDAKCNDNGRLRKQGGCRNRKKKNTRKRKNRKIQ